MTAHRPGPGTAASGSVHTVAKTWLSTEEWFASLPTAYLSAGLIITDRAGRLLVVKPNYRDDGWSIPGGIVEHGEPPHVAASREVAEELGLHIPAGDLLVVDWVAPGGERPRAITSYLFDGGTVDGPGRHPAAGGRTRRRRVRQLGRGGGPDAGPHGGPGPGGPAGPRSGRTVYLPAWAGR